MRPSPRWRGVVYLVCLLTVGGCSNKPPLVPAAGKAQSGGEPVAGASVTFIPDEVKNPQGRPAVGQTGADGSFQLQTAPHGTGAIPGFYRVTVTVYSSKRTFPAKYTQLDKTPLVVEIPAGGTTDLLLKLD